MATAADWLSAASFIGLAGSLYATGYDGLAYLMGWTGGYCLVAFLLAPYVRKLARYTIPDFLGTRFSSNAVRGLAALAAILCSFVYLVAQIQGVGLIATRFIGVDFAVGIFCGLAGILVCSFLGGMRAVTWTQVAQYIILIAAILIPVSMIAHKDGLGWVPQFNYGRLMARVEGLEKQVREAPLEQTVRDDYRRRADLMQMRLDTLPQSFVDEKLRLMQEVADLRRHNGPLREIKERERSLEQFPRDAAAAQIVWTQRRDEMLTRAAAPVPMHEPFPASSEEDRRTHERNFLSLLLCLSLGTASLPHILTRYNTTTSVASARRSVGWTLFFVALFYLTAPVLAVLIKYEILTNLVGHHFADLPQWLTQWRKVEPSLISLADTNGDGMVRWSEIQMQPDMVVLAAPEIAGLPRAVKSAGAPVPRIPEIGANAMMLGALATEVLFKGIALSRKEVQESLESEDKAIAKRLWSHRLSDIAVLAGVELTGDEATLCEQLEIFATWAGRYSTPKLVKDMMPLRRSPWTGQAMLPNTYSNVDFMRIRNLNARYRSRLPEMPEVQLGLASGR
ncbi:hypothetical protein KCU90_g7107, partial [Aureobasidium melanogenum]